MHETLRTTVTTGASTGVDALYALQRQVRPSQRKQRPTPAREKRIMSARSIIGAAYAILAITTSAVAHGPGDVVTPHFEHAIPNIPGKTLTALIVDYPAGGSSVPHTHADSAFIFAYVLSGEIESKVNDGPIQTFRAGESWYEPPAARHLVSRNASRTKPAKLLAVFVANSEEKALTSPVEESNAAERKQ